MVCVVPPCLLLSVDFDLLRHKTWSDTKINNPAAGLNANWKRVKTRNVANRWVILSQNVIGMPIWHVFIPFEDHSQHSCLANIIRPDSRVKQITICIVFGLIGYQGRRSTVRRTCMNQNIGFSYGDGKNSIAFFFTCRKFYFDSFQRKERKRKEPFSLHRQRGKASKVLLWTLDNLTKFHFPQAAFKAIVRTGTPVDVALSCWSGTETKKVIEATCWENTLFVVGKKGQFPPCSATSTPSSYYGGETRSRVLIKPNL